MNLINSILYTKDPGYIRVKLKALMDDRGITRYNLAKSINVRFEVIDRWYTGNVERIDLDIVARICCVLECDIKDIFEYVPSNSQSDDFSVDNRID